MKKSGLYYGLLSALVFGVFLSSQSLAQEEGLDEYAELTAAALAEFAEQDDIIKRPSGLLIKVIESGDGGIIKPTDRALVQYEGRLADGSVFDSSYVRGGPAVLPVNGVIRGWEEALLLMQIGSKWEIAVPPRIAYGKEGHNGIPPDSVLFFTVELVGVV